MAARTDQAVDPVVLADLELVRLGTAFFRRALDRLRDDELDAPSLLPGWSRRHLLAHVGYNARAVARLVTWAATGVETPMYASPDARGAEIEHGATLNPEALRNLVEHSALDLDVRWRDLPADRWAARVTTAQGRDVPASETVWMRTREVWLHAIDLDDGARFDQVPTAVLHRLVGDIHGAWSKRPDTTAPGMTVTDVPAGAGWPASEPGGPELSGRLSALAAWASGRPPLATQEGELEWTVGAARVAPRWI